MRSGTACYEYGTLRIVSRRTRRSAHDSALTQRVEARAYERRWWILAVLCFSLLVIVLDNTILNVAIPTIVRDLDATNSQLQWMVDAYTLVFAGLLLTAGSLGDRFGRRGALQFGLVIFGLGSLASAFADSAEQLIATRAFMGIGGAFIMPATLSIITNVFPPHERGKAIGVWAGTAGLAGVLGPLTGGFLLEHFYWGSIFLVNIPIVVVGLLAGHLPHPHVEGPVGAAARPGRRGAVDRRARRAALRHHRGAAARAGPTRTILACVRRSASRCSARSSLWERRIDHPMLDVRFFKNPRFTAASTGITLIFFAMFGVDLPAHAVLPVRARLLAARDRRPLPAVGGVHDDRLAAERALVDRVGTKVVVTAGLSLVDARARCSLADAHASTAATGPTSSGA